MPEENKSMGGAAGLAPSVEAAMAKPQNQGGGMPPPGGITPFPATATTPQSGGVPADGAGRANAPQASGQIDMLKSLLLGSQPQPGGANTSATQLSQLAQSLQGANITFAGGDASTVLQRQMQDALAAARGMAMPAAPRASDDALSRLLNGVAGGIGGGGAPPNVPLPATSVAAPQVIKRGEGAQAYFGWEHNGAFVRLGDDIDMNDAAAVQKRIAETNDLIDMMNGAYEES